MTTESWTTLAFFVIAVLLVAGALGVVLLPRIVHSALALVFFFFMTSGVFILLQAEFIAATQVIIYVGAITVLFLFAIMLTNRSYAADSNPPNSQWMAAVLVAVVTFGIFLATFLNGAVPVSAAATPGGVGDITRTLGELLMGPFLLPFEAAGVLLLAAMIGAIVIARET